MIKIKLFYVLIAMLIIILAIFFYTKESYLPGAIYFTQSDQKLETVLHHSGIKENLEEYYKFFISDSALNTMVSKGRYFSCSGYKFWKDYNKQIYLSLLGNIYLQNIDKFVCNITEKAIYINIKY